VGRKEKQLRELRSAPVPHDTAAIERLEREIDQDWDLIRQREALRDAGEDPSDAHERPQSQVENYRQ
jgi:hypothetical protein